MWAPTAEHQQQPDNKTRAVFAPLLYQPEVRVDLHRVGVGYVHIGDVGSAVASKKPSEKYFESASSINLAGMQRVQ
jgi:hypothetical protein